MGTEPSLEALGAALRPLLPPGCRAFLIGSRAEGRASPTSDWDIGILGRDPLRGADLERIRQALEDLPTLHRFDVVDLASAPERFRERALEHAIELARAEGTR